MTKAWSNTGASVIGKLHLIRCFSVYVAGAKRRRIPPIGKGPFLPRSSNEGNEGGKVTFPSSMSPRRKSSLSQLRVNGGSE